MNQQVTTQQVKGSFDVKRTAMETVDAGGDASFGRIRFEKRFHGDLDATSVVEMLSAGNPATGSAGYVAVEHLVGTLQGRKGRFMMQHNGVMNRGEASLTLTVVPDSGTDELTGLHGRMQIDIAQDGAHFYTFDYAID
ncbi:DUF3224 domain-containing protein [Lysobacter yangpyeongensis]|uniref:DUF3224 domain-containing protein n=1 Tax=Lysobacter yangpyeongensis TaxID=346182 RepID=A0ABW0SLX5_9GAMM